MRKRTDDLSRNETSTAKPVYYKENENTEKEIKTSNLKAKDGIPEAMIIVKESTAKVGRGNLGEVRENDTDYFKSNNDTDKFVNNNHTQNENSINNDNMANPTDSGNNNNTDEFVKNNPKNENSNRTKPTNSKAKKHSIQGEAKNQEINDSITGGGKGKKSALKVGRGEIQIENEENDNSKNDFKDTNNDNRYSDSNNADIDNETIKNDPTTTTSNKDKMKRKHFSEVVHVVEDGVDSIVLIDFNRGNV